MGQRRQSRVSLAYQPTGFQPRGGLQRLALQLVEHLKRSGVEVQVLLARGQRHGLEEHWPDLPICRRLDGMDALVLVGCDQPWAYRLALAQRLRRPRLRLHWLPSFHDPLAVRHPQRAQLAGGTLKLMQRLGVHVHAQTEHERILLDAGRCQLSSHALGHDLRRRLLQSLPPQNDAERSLDLLFVGRATAQKGWQRFLRLSAQSGLRCAAIVPSLQDADRRACEAAGLRIFLAPNDRTLLALLRQARLVTIPADYESFGLAQIEALSEGCLVPLFGHWPLWDAFPALRWQGWNEARIAAACRELCHNPLRRQQLVAAQQDYLRHHPILEAPFLPGLLPLPTDG